MERALKPLPAFYTVTVGNIGNINCESVGDAIRTFNEYVSQSETDYGRAAGESVTLFDDAGEILAEYIGKRNQTSED